VNFRVSWILLAISLAGNLFFVSGYFYADKLVGNLQKSPQSRMDHLSKRLQLDEPNKKALLEVRDSLASKSIEFGSSRKELMQGFWAQLNDREIDREKLQSQLKQLSELELAHRTQIVESVDGFLEQLNPSQRHRLLQLLDRRDLFDFMNKHSVRKSKQGS
jgi:uncharacterized membrane protein